MAEQPIVADRRLWQTRDGRLVEDGDKDAAFLVAGEGAEIDPETAARLGLSAKEGKVSQEKAPEKAPSPGSATGTETEPSVRITKAAESAPATPKAPGVK